MLVGVVVLITAYVLVAKTANAVEENDANVSRNFGFN